MQKKEKTQGTYTKYRKKYAYFDQMSFLLNSDLLKEDASRDDTAEGDDDFDDDPLEGELDEVLVKPEEIEVEAEYEPEQSTGNSEMDSTGDFQGKLVEVLDNMRSNEEDEDKQFMLSLVPCLRKLNVKQKFTAKIEILKVLKDITFQDS